MYLLASGKSRGRVIALSITNCFNPKLLMRVSLLSVALMACLVTLAGTSSGQSVEKTRVKVEFRNLSLRKALHQLELATGFSFTYRSIDVDQSAPVTYTTKDASLADVLGTILQEAGLHYVQRENNIILRKTESAADSTAMPDYLALFLPRADTIPMITVTGRVLSSEKISEPVPNASVTVKGTKYGTSTDPDGNFSIRIPARFRVLSFSQIGFEPVDVRIDTDGPMSVSMKPRPMAMTEVITTGLYRRPKESFTGAATTISGDQIRSVNMMNALQAIKMFDPSIRIPENLQFGSDPNRMPNISIRGTNNFPQQQGTSTGRPAAPPSGADFMASYSYNPNQPIFILDGFEVALQKIYDLDVSRIASYTILKDAAATSMYGSRAANGVIIVDTKQPAPGKLQVFYSGTMNLSAPDLSVYHLMNAQEKLQAEQLAGMYSDYSDPGGSNGDRDAYYRRLLSYRQSKIASGVNTDWLSKPLRNSLGQTHSLNLGGGDQSIRYALNLYYKSDPGVMKGSARDVYTGDMSLTYRFRGLNFRNAISITYNKSKNSPYGSFGDYSKQNNYWSPYGPNGEVVKILEQFEEGTLYTNPLYNATLNVIDNSEYTLLTNNTELEWNMGRGFRLTGSLGLTRQVEEGNLFLPAAHTAFAKETNYLKKGSYDRRFSKFFNYQARLKLEYSHRIGNGQLYNTTLIESNQATRNATTIRVEGFPHEKLDEMLFGNGYPVNSKPGGYVSITRRVSAGNNFSYNWDQRYVAEGSLRFDGSSQFGSNKRYAAFWSTGVSWNLHNEDFIAKMLPQVQTLRLRATIGSTGDDRFATDQAITTYQYFTGSNFHGSPGSYLTSYGNEDLTWQQAIKKNLGIDLVLFKGRISLGANLYNETTKSLLLDINTPPSVGVTSYKENVGKLQNNGFDANLNVIILQQPKRSITWTAFVNAAHNRTKIVSISNALKKLNDLNDKNNENQQIRPQFRYVEGYSPNAIWGVRSLGIDPSTGREIFLNKDGKPTLVWDPADKVIIGDPTGGVFGNFGSSFTYKDLTLGIACNYQAGIDQYNQTLADRVENVDLRYQADRRVLLDRWKKPGDQTFFKGLSDENGRYIGTKTNVTSRFLQRNNYINVSSISLGYQVPANFTKRLKLGTTRITLIANEIARWGNLEMERGLDYPFARNFTLNLTSNF